MTVSKHERTKGPCRAFWQQELDEISAHLGAAIIQSTSSDDQSIMDHVKAAYEIAKIVCRKSEATACPFRIGARVKYSTRFIRSIGNVGLWRVEVIGEIIDTVTLNSTKLALVCWRGGNGYSEVNVENLVLLENTYKEACQAEADGIPGLALGSNAYARF